MKQSIRSIILAAGKSSRLQTGRTKLVEKICGQEMILFATKLLQDLDIPTTVVVGYDKEKVISTVQSHHNQPITFIEQKEQLGTGHALAITKETWDTEHILVLNGDVPLITEEVISDLCTQHTENNAAISFVVSYFEEPNHPYGRVFTDNGKISIIEARDLELNDPRQDHPWINAGIYVINKKFLQESISQLNTNNSQNEFYITDLINIANKQEKHITTITAPFDTIRGVNTFEELWAVEHIKRAQLVSYWMDKGVRFSVAQNTHIDMQVSIGAGTYVGCGVHLMGNTIIGTNCYIHEFSSIEESVIGNNVQVYSHSIIANAKVNDACKIGPFAHLRDDVTLGKDVVIGNFVEASKSQVDDHSRAPHASYIDNTHVQSNSSISAFQSTSNTLQAQTETKKSCNLTTTQKEKKTTKKSGTLFMGAQILQDFSFHEDQ